MTKLRWNTGKTIDPGWGWAVKSAFKANKKLAKVINNLQQEILKIACRGARNGF
jgi:hypothetical protein